MRLFLVIALLAIPASLGGCTTQFYGSPMFPGGASACFSQCERQNMQMGAFVYMGEYSTGCVCEPRGAQAGSAHGSVGAAMAAVAVRTASQHAAASSEQ